MSLKTSFFSQFGDPHGPLGRLAGHVMAAKGDNRTRGRWTVDLLALESTDRVLELGYGPGVVTGWLCDEVPEGHVVGVDRSATMRDQATRRNRAHVSSGRLDLRVGDAEHLPDGLGPFDAACGMNVWQFWQQPEATFAAIGQRLRPGGRIAVTYLQPPSGSIDADDAADRISAQLTEADFVDRRVERLPIGAKEAICCLARTPG